MSNFSETLKAVEAQNAAKRAASLAVLADDLARQQIALRTPASVSDALAKTQRLVGIVSESRDQRLDVCRTCSARVGTTCSKNNCFIGSIASITSFTCPLEKW